MATELDTTVSAKRFAKGDALYVQAQQMWVILVGFIMMRKYPAPSTVRKMDYFERIAYGELAEIMGRPGGGNMLSRQLGILGRYCVQNGLPALNVIVVNKDSEMPGDGAVVRLGMTVEEEMREVENFNWFTVRPPTVGALRKVYDNK